MEKLILSNHCNPPRPLIDKKEALRGKYVSTIPEGFLVAGKRPKFDDEVSSSFFLFGDMSMSVVHRAVAHIDAEESQEMSPVGEGALGDRRDRVEFSINHLLVKLKLLWRHLFGLKHHVAHGVL